MAVDFKEKAAERIRQSQAAEAMKRLTTHLKFKNYALGVRVFVAWANHMRALENHKAMEFMRHEKEKFEAQIISLHQDIEFARAEALTQSLSARVRFSGRNTRTSFS